MKKKIDTQDKAINERKMNNTPIAQSGFGYITYRYLSVG